MSSSSSPSGTSKAAPYLALTRKLAHSEKKVRDRAVRIVNKWLGHQPNVGEEDLRKLWQGLFFCMWHADKMTIQAEVAVNLASLVHALGSLEGGMRYFAAGLWTLQQRWETIDKHRVDKYLSLLRHLLRQSLILLARHQWRAEDIAVWSRAMINLPFGSLASSDASRVLPLCPGIALHFTDIFMDELKIAAQTNTGDGDAIVMRMGAVNDLLEPFIHAVTRYPHKLVVNRVDHRILRPIVDKADRTHPSTSPLHFLDFVALSERFFECATSRDTEEGNRGRLYGYRKSLKIQLAQSAGRMEVVEALQSTTNGEVHAANGKHKKARTEEATKKKNKTQVNGREEKDDANAEAEQQDEGEEEAADDGMTTESPLTKKRKAMSLTTARRIRTPQHNWITAYRKKALTIAHDADHPGLAVANGSSATESDTMPIESNGSATKQKKNRVRFSLESNSAKEFCKKDPPVMASANANAVVSSPQKPDRKPAVGILKSPAKKNSQSSPGRK